jgi:hypothetical protein
MPEVNKTYNFDSMYIFGIILLYTIFTSNYEYIKLFISKITLFNYSSLIIFINITGIYLFLKNISFEINFKISYKNVGICQRH